MQSSSDRHGGGGAGSVATAFYPWARARPVRAWARPTFGPAPAARM